MPLFVDRHDLKGTSAAEVAQAHLHDLEIQDAYGVKYLTYWFDEGRGTAFCLVDAPDRETAERVHRDAHGLVASAIIEVDPSTVEAFLGRLHHETATHSAHGFRAVAFTDIVGSTEMTLRLGDRAALEVVRAHDSLVRRCLAGSRGREVKHTGDGIMASFEAIHDAVTCSKAIQSSVAAFNQTSRNPFQVRIGLHAGEPVEDSRDLFGATVQLAARLCQAAEPEQILASSLVAEALGSPELLTQSRTVALKGFNSAQTVFALPWR